MPLIRDLIAIPERVHQGDFVLKLSEGVAQAEQTLRDYVVTPELAAAFRNALGFIQQAVISPQAAMPNARPVKSRAPSRKAGCR